MLQCNCAADQHLCFRYIDSTLNPKLQASIALFCGCTALFASDLVGNLEERFSLDAAQLVQVYVLGTA